MSQHDYTISNQTSSSARTDINNALKALASTNSGTTAPSTTYANMLWYETDTNTLWIRNEANNAWLRMAYVDQSNGMELIDNSAVVNTSGTQIGKLGSSPKSTWTAGTDTVEQLISPYVFLPAVRDSIVSEVTVASNGKLKLWNGLKFIWGQYTSSTDNQETISFWEAFDTACYACMTAGMDITSLGGAATVNIYNITTTGFTTNRDDNISGDPTMRYFAIGKD